MANPLQRFQFIAHALAGDGPFRPEVGSGGKIASGATCLVRYARESDKKFASRNEIAFYASPLAEACGRFVGYLFGRAPQREITNDLYKAMADDIDGQGNAIDVFWQSFAIDAKARGSMLLLVDMPSNLPGNQAEQLASRTAPFWAPIKPESVTAYEMGDDGKFNSIEFKGSRLDDAGKQVQCTWLFTRSEWAVKGEGGAVIESGEIPFGECPVLAFTEKGGFPSFGSFAPIADLSKRVFNADSELDEILRSQTFSLLTMQAPNSTNQDKLTAAQTAGETISTNNLLMHEGNTPAFIAPPDGPATVYGNRLTELRSRIDEIGLNVAATQHQESGIALQMRFQRINGELAYFASRMEDLERRAWELSRKWLGLQESPETTWPRDFNLADLATELQVLAAMRESGMPSEVVREQEKRIVALQFAGLPADRMDALISAIDAAEDEPPAGDNVIPLDPNADLRAAVTQRLRSANATQ